VGTPAAPLDPLLGPLQNNGGSMLTQAPLQGSPLIGGGSLAALPAGTLTDQAGFPRTSNGTLDIGAVQAEPTVLVKIVWASPADITFGTALSATQLDATANVPGTFTYTPAAGTVLKVGQGQTLSVTFTPTDSKDFATTTATTTINVTPATPTITWAAPAPITYGTALSTTQLNATASTPGTFTYTPAAGTVLQPGANQVLSVTFTPTDSTDFKPATMTAAVTVTPPPPPPVITPTPAPVITPTPTPVTTTTTPTLTTMPVMIIDPSHVKAHHGVAKFNSAGRISVSDSHTKPNLHIRISTTAGILQVSTAGVSVAGNKSKLLVLRGTASAINNALGSLSLTLGKAHQATVMVFASDDTDTDQTTINVS
jgi:hypothetical protein